MSASSIVVVAHPLLSGVLSLFSKTFAIVVLLSASSADATTKPGKLAINPDSKEGAIIFAGPELSSEYRIAFGPFDASTRRVHEKNFKWIDVKAVRKGGKDEQFFITDIKPGTYVVFTVSQQQHWSLCYAAATYQFTVLPGQVSYIGHFDAPIALRELQGNAMGSGKYSSNPIQFFQFFAVTPPPLSNADNADDLRRAGEWLKIASPRTTAVPTVAVLTPTSFLSGDTTPVKGKCLGTPAP